MTPPEPFKMYYDQRVDSLVELYANVAEQAFGTFLDEAINSASLDGFSPFDDPDGLMEQYERRRVAGIKTIVFAAMAIEAAAFEFSAIALGDKTAKTLDRLDLEGKWVIGTRLAFGQALNAKSPAINGLRSLVKARNDLVHHKSSPADSEGKSVEKMMKRWTGFENDQVSNAFKTLVLLSLELEALPEGVYGLLPHYGNDPFYDFLRHAGIKAVIEGCRVTHRKHQEGA